MSSAVLEFAKHDDHVLCHDRVVGVRIAKVGETTLYGSLL